MKVAFGTTVWRKGILNQHLDGIGNYTSALHQSLTSMNVMQVIQSYFGPYRLPLEQSEASLMLSRYSYSAITSALSGAPFFDGYKLDQVADIFHATDHYIPKLKNTPVIATLMDAIPLSHPHWAGSNLRSLKNWVWKKSSHWADHIITISDFSKKEIIKYFNINENKISVIRLGVDSSYFSRIEPHEIKKVLDKNKIHCDYFLFIGTLQPRKNVERIIQAYLMLPANMRNKSQLVIAGKKGWGCDELVSTLKNQSIKSGILWLDSISEHEKKALMQQAIALVFPSLLEGFGLPVLEGFASQTPVITSNSTSLIEVAGDAALTIDPYDVNALSLAMKKVLIDDDVRNVLVQLGLARARLFNWDSCAEKTVDIYRRFK